MSKEERSRGGARRQRVQAPQRPQRARVAETAAVRLQSLVAWTLAWAAVERAGDAEGAARALAHVREKARNVLDLARAQGVPMGPLGVLEGAPPLAVDAYTAWRAKLPTCPPHEECCPGEIGSVALVGCPACEWKNGAPL